jgi:hypothetical protein
MTLKPVGEALSGGTRTVDAQVDRGKVIRAGSGGKTRCFASQLIVAGECWLISVETISMR